MRLLPRKLSENTYEREFMIRIITASTIILNCFNAYALEEEDYRGRWLASNSAIKNDKPKSIDVGYLGAEIGDSSCDISYPVTFDSNLGFTFTKAMEVHCDGYQSVTLAYFDYSELWVYFGDFKEVKCELNGVQRALKKKLGHNFEDTCKLPKKYSYTLEGIENSVENAPKLKTF